MMTTDPEISRDELFALAASPIGGADVAALARQHRAGDRVPEKVKEAAKRAAKIWLPRGRKAAKRPPEDTAAQIDLEDAVEAAGGQRGSAGR